MENKKLGFVILSFSIIATVLAYGFMGVLGRQTAALQCYPTSECQRVQSLLGLSHIAVGLISFIGALGIYLLFFSTSEEAILRRLEEEKNVKTEQNKFELILKAMDDNEKKVLKAVKEQEGITQSTLRYRTDLSKAKVSQILTDFEKKHLVKRELKGKTYAVYLVENF
ncbi:winged helix-turn-helix transcriptional regulator [Candidatus Woesearchaeota archaeon]|nr:winged helix-turn-helix transcriptional regulator [Candidatus Woesearchaeota archaeon]